MLSCHFLMIPRLPVLTLSVAYETHCPDSQDFITRQLWEVFKELKPPSKVWRQTSICFLDFEKSGVKIDITCRGVGANLPWNTKKTNSPMSLTMSLVLNKSLFIY